MTHSYIAVFRGYGRRSLAERSQDSLSGAGYVSLGMLVPARSDALWSRRMPPRGVECSRLSADRSRKDLA
jgi:hypothetical protein